MRVHAVVGGAERECVQLEVEDNGEGMSPATLARVFEPYFSTKFHGRGLGLSAVRGIVLAHGGDLQLSSRPGVGTLARVQLPLSREAVAPKSPSASPSSARGERVLVVDDEPAVARVAARALQHFGYSTAIASSGREALTLLAGAQERVDCVLLDRTMPDLSGEETLALLRERDPQLVVVLTSGYEEAQSLVAARRVSPNAFLRKPYAPDELARAVRAALDAARTPQGAGPLS
jgi:CheY-like chemotaxis protein